MLVLDNTNVSPLSKDKPDESLQASYNMYFADFLRLAKIKLCYIHIHKTRKSPEHEHEHRSSCVLY